MTSPIYSVLQKDLHFLGEIIQNTNAIRRTTNPEITKLLGKVW